MSDVPKGFQARDGWYFRRNGDGAVHITAPDSMGPGAHQVVLLDADTWAAVVASVSRSGPEVLARTAYAAYGEATGGKTHDGRNMPAWDDLGDTIQGAWAAAGRRRRRTHHRFGGDSQMKTILGRDPVLYTTLAAAILQYANAVWFGWSDHQTAVINAAISIIAGAVAVAGVSVDRLLPFLSGITQALINVFVAFHVNWSQADITAFMAIVAAALAFFGVRPKVVAMIDSNWRPVPKQPVARLKPAA